MLKITLIRHGKTKGNSIGQFIGVTDEHILGEERESLGQLSFPKAEEVYISPMIRCRETAEILYPDIETVVVEELSECDFGRLEGKTYQEIHCDPNYKNWLVSEEITSFPGGESRSEFQARSIAGFEKVVKDALKKRRSEIAVIAHGGTIMSVLDAYGFPRQRYIDWFVENGEGYQIRLKPEEFLNKSDTDIIVDRKIIRSAF